MYYLFMTIYFIQKMEKYTLINFYYNVLRRYIDIFSKVTFLARSVEVEDTKNFALASGNGVEFVFVKSISSIKSYFGHRQQQEKLIRNLIKEHDKIIVRLPSEYGLLTAKVAYQMDVTHAVEVVGCAWDAMWNYGGIKSKIYAPFFFLKMRKIVKQSKYILYVTSQFLQTRYPSSPYAITTNVSNVELPDLENHILEKRLKKISSNNDKIVFGTIGSLKTRYKGVHIAIQALSTLSGKFNNFEYHILGAGNSKNYFELAKNIGIDDKIFFEGVLPSGKPIFDWLNTVDIYLQPSLQEGLPRALIEAMSRACPAIGSTAGGIPELLNEEMIFDIKKSEDFPMIIEKLLQNKLLMEKEAKANFKTAISYQKNSLDTKRKEFWLNFQKSTN